MPKQHATKDLNYLFKLGNSEEREFQVKLRLPQMALAMPNGQAPPRWAELQNEKCSHCPLRADRASHCPIAVSLAPVIEVFKDCLSHDVAEVRILTEERDYHKSVPLQTGISSLMGLIMVTSGCPIMDKLRPMVLTHLPFANVEETLYRAMSSYLMAQHFRHKRGEKADWELTHFGDVYKDVVTLNRCFSKRLRSMELRDATLNALIQLDCFAVYGSFDLDQTTSESIEPLFEAYLDQPDSAVTPPSTPDQLHEILH